MRTRDVAGHVLDAGPHDLRMWGDLPLTGPERTWCDLAGALSLRQLVAAGDHLIHHRQPLTTPHELRAAVDRFAGHRGVRALRAALPLLSDRAESPAESELRVVLALAGLPTPLVNHEIRTRTGRFIARVDLLFPENRLVVEYQGDHHRTDQKQWRRDLARAAELESERYRVTEVTADDLRSEPALIARIRRLLSFPVPLSRHESGV
ncbi:hypothetical protein [Compostimonas suwonensis]|uniref:hypothetical protein n=1 Tax=Compostimonas suwonensis TaxID=1048394 RepID=UPI0012FDD914|nr:hypothetical protein [Compostimonas suwonensis]